MSTTIGGMTTEDAASEAAGNWRRFTCFVWDRTLPTMGYPTLRKLYALVVMLKHDLTREKASSEVEHHAAFRFIEGACANIPRYDSTQRLLPLTG